MSWSAVPSFTDGTVLSATPLNTISQDLAHLYGLLNMANPATCSLYSGVNLTSSNNTWSFRHKGHGYIHYYAYVQAQSLTQFQIVVNGTSVFNDTTTRFAGYTYSGSASISGAGMTSGGVYTAYINATLAALAAVRVYYLIISEASSL
jgi:hypothetical protein